MHQPTKWRAGLTVVLGIFLLASRATAGAPWDDAAAVWRLGDPRAAAPGGPLAIEGHVQLGVGGQRPGTPGRPVPRRRRSRRPLRRRIPPRRRAGRREPPAHRQANDAVRPPARPRRNVVRTALEPRRPRRFLTVPHPHRRRPVAGIRLADRPRPGGACGARSTRAGRPGL